ncbi:MAG: TolC family protein [Chitinophagales bacterium]
MNQISKEAVTTWLILVFLCFSELTFSQTTISLDSAVAAAMRNHPAVKQSQTEILQQQQLKKSSFSLPNPELGIEIPAHEFSWSVSQNIDFPLVYINQSKLGKENIALAEQGLALTQNDLRSEVNTAFLQLQFAQAQMAEFKIQDSLFFALSTIADRRAQAGEIGLLEQLNANNAYQNKHSLWLQSQIDFAGAQKQLVLLVGLSVLNLQPDQALTKFSLPPVALNDSVPYANPFAVYAAKNTLVALQNWKLEKSKAFPGFFGTYLNNGGDPAITPSRLDVGIAIPLWFWQYAGRMKAAKYQWQSATYLLDKTTLAINAQWQQGLSDFSKNASSLNYYENSALPQATKIIDASTRSYNADEIGYVELLQNLNTAFETKLGYLNVVRDFNQSIIQLHKLSGQ